MLRTLAILGSLAVLYMASHASGLVTDLPEAEIQASSFEGGTVDGTISGNVACYRVVLEPPPRLLRITDGAIRYLQIETRYNHSNVQYLPGFIDPVDYQQTLTWTNVSAQEVLLDWPIRDSDTVMLLHEAGFMTWTRSPMKIDVNATGASWSAPMRGGDGIPFMWPGPDKPMLVLGGLPAWHQVLRLDDADPTEIHAPFVLQLRQARITADGAPVAELPAYETKTAMLPANVPGASRTQTTLTEGFLYVDAGRVTLDLSGAQLLVGEMDWNVAGDTVWGSATGTYRIGGHEGHVAAQSVGLSGRYHVHESVVTRDDEQAPAMGEVSATGSFAVLAVDYIVQAAAPSGPSLVEQALWVTLVVGVLGVLAWAGQHGWVLLYSRIKEDAVLEHPKRADIMQFVRENPGCHVLRVASDLGLARGVARHHLMILERAGRVRQYREAGQTFLVPAGQPKVVVLRQLAAEDPRMETIRASAAGGVRRADLVAMLRSRHGVSDPTARRWIDKAVRLGLVAPRGAGHSVTYHASQRA